MSRRLTLIGGLLCLLLAHLGLAASKPSTARSPRRPEYLHPDFQIAGMPKAGTSHMYQLLSTHRDAKAVRKEWCPSVDSMHSYAQELSAAIRGLMSEGMSNDGKIRLTGAVPKSVTKAQGVVGACINPVLSLHYYKWVTRTGPRCSGPQSSST